MVSRGRGRLGCLFFVLIVAVVVYYGIPLVRMYWKYYRLTDEMRTTARFAPSMQDEEVLRRLRATVDELELPAEAKRFAILRTPIPIRVTIRTQYHVVIELPFHNRIVTLRPAAEARQ